MGAGAMAWFNISSGLGVMPPPRRGAAMTYDPSDGYTVLFGGLDPTGRTLRDTWAYGSNGWVALSPAVATAKNTPPALAFASMTFDTGDGYVLLFGGLGPRGVNGESWSFARGHWSVVTSSSGTTPTGRVNASLAYDANDSYAVLFGGFASGHVLRDTWAYHAGGWVELTPANLTATSSPTRRFGAALAFDPSSNDLVFFGGTGSTGFNVVPQNDTWVFSAGSWRNVTTGPAPPARWAAGTAFDATNAGLLVFGGISRSGRILGDTWALRSGTWTNLTPLVPTSPSPRSTPAVASVTPTNASGSLVLLFGGASATGLPIADTWVFGAGSVAVTAPSFQPPATDANRSVHLAAAAYGGSGGYTFAWTGLPPGCDSINASAIDCQPTSPGLFPISVVVHDGVGDPPASATATLAINPAPTIAGLTASPFTAYAGTTNVSFVATVAGGTGHLTFSYAGLPPGCAPTNTSKLRCTPTSAGTFPVTVSVVDEVNASAQATVTLYVRNPGGAPWLTAPRIAAIAGVGVVTAVVLGLVVRRRRRRHPVSPLAARDFAGDARHDPFVSR
ncbi:MAG: hypothetical protein L3K15_04805 [Thermoplasmata archaeon]|nr:hypothetical protein [Thermoplasmata archaeon]